MAELHDTYMGTAFLHARKSKAIRKKVGACIVTKNGVILAGYNGTPAGWDNYCENITEEAMVTKAEVIHAELNCIMKAAREGVSVKGATAYITLAPCVQCSAMMAQAGISTVYYAEDYRDLSGVHLLRQHGIFIERLEYAN
jgi:dCMP deaminase